MFDVKAEELKEEWVQLLQGYTRQSPTSNGHLPGRSVHVVMHILSTLKL